MHSDGCHLTLGLAEAGSDIPSQKNGSSLPSFFSVKTSLPEELTIRKFTSATPSIVHETGGNLCTAREPLRLVAGQ